MQKSPLPSPMESFTFVHRGATPSSSLVLTFAFAQPQMTIQHESQDDEEGVMNINNPHRHLSWRQNWASSSNRTERYKEPLVSIYPVTLSNYSYIWSKVKIPFIPVNEGHVDQDFDMTNYSLSSNKPLYMKGRARERK